jgi:hypothetical protein
MGPLAIVETAFQTRMVKDMPAIACIDAIDDIVIARVILALFAERTMIMVSGAELFLGVVDVVGDVVSFPFR